MRGASFALAVILAIGALSGCGSSSKRATGTSTAAVGGANQSSASEFPAANGRNIFQLAKALAAQANVGLATSAMAVGTDRLAYGVIGANNQFVYGASAVYLAYSVAREVPTEPAIVKAANTIVYPRTAWSP